MNYKIQTKDDDTGEWQDATDSDGLREPNEFNSRFAAEDSAKAMVRRCAYRFPWRIVKS